LILYQVANIADPRSELPALPEDLKRHSWILFFFKMKRFDHFINGEYRPSLNGATIDVINPCNRKKICYGCGGR
jgi:hypothetical protein